MKTIRQITSAAMLYFAAVSLVCLILPPITGCSSTQVAAGHDPFVVEAEKDLRSAFHVVDDFLAWEHANRRTLSPAVTSFADDLRIQFPAYLQSAEDTLRTYKRNRTPENKASLSTWLATVQAAMAQAITFLPPPEAAAAKAKLGT